MQTIVDVSFPLDGGSQILHVDHSYALYGALSAVVPELHEAPGLGIFSLKNVIKRDLRLITNDQTNLRLRLPLDQIPVVFKLVGQTISLQGASFRVLPFTVHPLTPCFSLEATRVTFSLTHLKPDDTWDRALELFEQTAFRHLKEIGISCQMEITGKQRLAIKGIKRMAWSVRCYEFESLDQSLLLKTQGLGGKRKFGCGLFRDTNPKLLLRRQAKGLTDATG
jgi:CRISPR-associated protein Cas6